MYGIKEGDMGNQRSMFDRAFTKFISTVSRLPNLRTLDISESCDLNSWKDYNLELTHLRCLQIRILSRILTEEALSIVTYFSHITPNLSVLKLTGTEHKGTFSLVAYHPLMKVLSTITAETLSLRNFSAYNFKHDQNQQVTYSSRVQKLELINVTYCFSSFLAHLLKPFPGVKTLLYWNKEIRF
ncbi:hypothetical protein BKA69DRAFT_1042585 [Paraphysoderma sedebokerense]|nr:hypothetical protein BKA69DRAFT_1042585 [Paraphysoderma sedebokerense]